jgi:hypothetical protein
MSFNGDSMKSSFFFEKNRIFFVKDFSVWKRMKPAIRLDELLIRWASDADLR